MKPTLFLLAGCILAAAITSSPAADADADDNAIVKAMKFAHAAPKGEKKLNEKIVAGAAPDADVEKALGLYKAMLDTKPPKGDAVAFKTKTEKLIAATEEVIAKKPDAIEHYKDAVNCKACHSEHRKMQPPGPGGAGRPVGAPAGPGGPFPSPQ